MWINHFRAEHRGRRSWYFYEPLQTSAPFEACQPYCCYMRTIIFYKQPYVIGPDGGYLEWDRVETAWDLLGQRWTDADLGWSSLAPLVFHEEKIFELGTGEVIYHEGQWFMRWLGWRVTPFDFRYPFYLQRAMREIPMDVP